MTITLTWILGAIAGAVLWSAFLRLPGHLARWLCAPFDHPGRVTVVLSMVVSVAFLALMVIGALLGLCQLIDHTADAEDAKRLREVLFISSILGYAVIPVLARLEELIGGRGKM